MLIEGLAKIIPGLPVVGEEGAHADPSSATTYRAIAGSSIRSTGRAISPTASRRSASCWPWPREGRRIPGGYTIVCPGRFCIAHKGKGAFVDGEKVTRRRAAKASRWRLSRCCSWTRRSARRCRTTSRRITALSTSPIVRPNSIRGWCLAPTTSRCSSARLPWDHAAGALFAGRGGRQGRAARRLALPGRRVGAARTYRGRFT